MGQEVGENATVEIRIVSGGPREAPAPSVSIARERGRVRVDVDVMQMGTTIWLVM
jgi:hypothetical protein